MLPGTMQVMKAGTPHPHHLTSPCPSTPSLAPCPHAGSCPGSGGFWGAHSCQAWLSCACPTVLRASWSSSLFPGKLFKSLIWLNLSNRLFCPAS